MVELLSCLMKKTLEGSLLVGSGHPKGAVALAAAGVSSNDILYPVLANKYARSRGPFGCSIQARKSAATPFPVNLTEVL